ncbi:MAG: Ppx/GppA family phosphatase, partial [Cyanobacteria bacterium J06649_4]
VVRYHRKSYPKPKHKKFNRLSKEQQNIVWVLAGLLRIAVGLDRTKDQSVEKVDCRISREKITITASGKGSLDVGVWAAMCDRQVLEKALERTVTIAANS